MLGLGFVASLAIIRVKHNYGKFKISVAIPKLHVHGQYCKLFYLQYGTKLIMYTD